MRGLIYQLEFDNVIGLYSDLDQAEKAINHLRAMGISVTFTIIQK